MRSAIILAAGKGTRMKSDLCKVMHKISNKPMIGHLVDTLERMNVSNIVVVVGYGKEDVMDYLKERVAYVEQKEILGTGHAVMQAESYLKDVEGDTLVLNGDGPLLQEETLEKLFVSNKTKKLTLLSAILEDGAHYGRVIRDAQGHVVKIQEAKDCNPQELEVSEINTGQYCFNNQLLFQHIHALTNENKQKEYYLTDMVSMFYELGFPVEAIPVQDIDEVMGVNDRYELSLAQAYVTKKTNIKHMRQGVTIVDPNTTYIDVDVIIEEEVILEPNVTIKGTSVIKRGVHITSGSVIENSLIHEDVLVENCKIIDSEIGKGTTIGPMAHARAHTHIGEGCRIGNFVELKNTNFGNGSKCAHLTYLGDSDIGEKVNIGCGVVTVNYDGKNKFRTTIKDGAFIGSNVNIIAPVVVGENALLAAGSTITKDVPDGDMGIARGRQENKAGFGTAYKTK